MDFEIENGILKKYHSSQVHVVIPYGVKVIGDGAFRDARHVTSVVCPDGVWGIGDNAFSGCSELEEIVLPDGLEYIGSDAFAYCKKLKKLVIPDGVTELCDKVFEECGAETIFIPKSVKRFGMDVFCDCYTREIILQNGITEIPDNLFCGHHHLETIMIPYSVTRIGISAFRYCSSLTSFTIPENARWIGDSAFEESGLRAVTIPASVGEKAFYNCRSLTSVTLRESVRTIGDRAFMNCLSLDEIIVMGKETDINGWGAGYCDSYTYWTEPDGWNHEAEIYVGSLVIHASKGSSAHRYADKKRFSSL